MSKRLLVVWCSMTDCTRQLVDAFCAGAAGQDDVDLDVRRAEHADVAAVLAADALLFATPENLASMAGMMKDFFDRSYYGVLDRVDGRPYATLICAGSDGQGAARQIARIATGWRLKAVAEPTIVISHAQTPAAILASKIVAEPDLARARELGALLASGVSLGIW